MAEQERFRNTEAVYTCVTGNYDRLLPPLATVPSMRFVAFTDNPKLHVDGWETIVLENREKLSPALLNRHVKLFPWKYLPTVERSIYIDGNIRVLADPKKLFELLSDGYEIVLFRHPERNTVAEEVAACAKENKGKSKALLYRELQEIENDGYVEKRRLTENNVLVRSHTSECLINATECWWRHLLKFSGRDQISLAYCLGKESTKELILPFCARERNPWFEWYQHYSKIESRFERLLFRLKARENESKIHKIVYRLARRVNDMNKNAAKKYEKIFARH